MGLSFEWDPSKEKINLKKHGISFEEATTVFNDPFSLTIPDPIHSFEEERFITIGKSMLGKTIVVIHVDRGNNIRVISARKANHQEIKNYEEKKTK